MGKAPLMLLAAVSLVGCATNDVATVDYGSEIAVRDVKVSCGLNAYINAAGACISEQILSSEVPLDATAKCTAQVEGRHWYSFSQSRRGTCSQFGGVLQWCELGKCKEK